jgi:hypothetical protein
MATHFPSVDGGGAAPYVTPAPRFSQAGRSPRHRISGTVPEGDNSLLTRELVAGSRGHLTAR